MFFQPGQNRRIDVQEDEKISPQVKAILTLTVLSALGAVYYVVGSNSRGVPNAPKNGVTLQDKELNHELTCYREAFNDSIQGQVFENIWFQEHCAKHKVAVDAAMATENPLGELTKLRDDVLLRNQQQGGDIKPGDVKWYKSYIGQSDGFGMKIELSDQAKMVSKQNRQAPKRIHRGQTR